MGGCYENKSHYICSGVSNIISIKTEHESNSFFSIDFIPNRVIIPLLISSRPSYSLSISTSFTSKFGLSLRKHLFWHGSTCSFDLFCIAYLWSNFFLVILSHSFLKFTTIFLLSQAKTYKHCIY